MDFLHVKAASDLHRMVALSDDEFYNRHSCTWLQGLKRAIEKVWQPNAQHDVGAKEEVKVMGA